MEFLPFNPLVAMKKEQEKSSEYKELQIDGSRYKTLYTTKYSERKPFSLPDEKKLLSVLPGTTREVMAKPGDQVKPGQRVIIYEAMKMINTIQAPREGRVKEIYAKPGESFPKNFVLLELE